MLVTGGTHAGEFFRLLGDGHGHGIDGSSYALPGARGRDRGRARARRALRGGRPRPRDARGQHLRAVDQAGGRELSSSRSAARASSSPRSRSRSTCAISGVAELDGDKRRPHRREAGDAALRVRRHGRSTSTTRRCSSSCRRCRRPRAESSRSRTSTTGTSSRARWSTTCVEGFWGDAGESIDAYYEVNDFVRAERRQQVIEGLRRIPLRRFDDERGWFMELMRASALAEAGAAVEPRRSRAAGVIRGLHYHERGQDDLFACVSGMVRVVVLDRETGETFTEDIGDDNPVAHLHPGHQRARLRGADRLPVPLPRDRGVRPGRPGRARRSLGRPARRRPLEHEIADPVGTGPAAS